MYIDGFLLALPKKDVDAYRRWARRAGKVWRKHGALEVKECVGDQLTGPDSAGKVHSPFPRLMKLERGETVWFSFVVFKSRAHRDRVTAKVQEDPHSVELMKPESMPFDPRRMAYGGFRVIVDL